MELRIVRLLASAAAACLPLGAFAGLDYFKWNMVELPAASGAACGNGSPYRFFVNPTPFTSKTIVIFEGGGACYGQAACQYRDGFLGAINPNGIPKDYMTKVVPSLPNTSGTQIGVFNSALLGYITPFATRTNDTKVQTQGWNIVYMTYCTGDVFIGNKVGVYDDEKPNEPLTYYHRGVVNTEAAARWLQASLPRPSQLLVSGFSAGGVGATANYAYLRETLKPTRSAMLADSGPVFEAPRTASPQQAPSVLLHARIRQAWGLDEPQGIIARLRARYPDVQVDDSNLAILNKLLPQVFPKDRFGFTLTQNDTLFSAFAYDNFFPEIKAASSIDQRNAMRVARWQQEITPWIAAMQPHANVGWYLPYARPTVLKSHTTTMLTFKYTGIAEARVDSVGSFVDNLIDGSGTPMRLKESPHAVLPTAKEWIEDWLQNLVFDSLGL